jgi:hypothetical protein
MRHTNAILAAALLAAALATTARADGIGLSINVGEPGFYGRIDIGDAPAPQLVQPRPVWIERPRGAAMPQPIYLHVPPGHQRNWRRYCHQYNACGEPVLFVRDSWYQNSYVPHYRERNRHAEGERGEHGDRGEHGNRGDHEPRQDRG